MRKIVVFIVLMVIVVIVSKILISGIPIRDEKVARMAKMNAQSSTYQIYTVKNIRYNILSKKYYIILLNNETNEKSKMTIWFDEEYDRSNMYHCEWDKK